MNYFPMNGEDLIENFEYESCDTPSFFGQYEIDSSSNNNTENFDQRYSENQLQSQQSQQAIAGSHQTLHSHNSTPSYESENKSAQPLHKFNSFTKNVGRDFLSKFIKSKNFKEYSALFAKYNIEQKVYNDFCEAMFSSKRNFTLKGMDKLSKISENQQYYQEAEFFKLLIIDNINSIILSIKNQELNLKNSERCESQMRWFFLYFFNVYF